MAKLKVDTLTADTWKNSDGTENYKVRAYVNFNGIDPITIRSSGNVSSVTDSGAADYDISFLKAMPHANYAATFSYSSEVATYHTLGFYNLTTPMTTSKLRLSFYDPTSSSRRVDKSYVTVMVVC